MKKIVVSILVMVAFTSNVFSVNPNERLAISKLYNQSNFNSLVGYLDADSVQVNQLKNAFSISDSNLKKALKTGNEIAADKAIWFSLGSARQILSTKQYEKIMAVLYASLNDNNKNQYLTER